MRVAASGFVDPEAPRGAAGILDLVEIERKRINRSFSTAMKELEQERDRELKVLGEAAVVLGRGTVDAQESPQPRLQHRHVGDRRPKSRANPTQEALKRREAVHRYVQEQEQPVPTAQIRGALRMTTSSTAGALKRLCDEGKLSRTGIGSSTRYQATATESKGPSLGAVAEGTPGGRILALVQDRGTASREELAQALRLTPEQIQRECGALIREEELRMTRRGSDSVYVSPVVA